MELGAEKQGLLPRIHDHEPSHLIWIRRTLSALPVARMVDGRAPHAREQLNQLLGVMLATLLDEFAKARWVADGSTICSR